MKYFVASMYQKGMVIVRANNKTEAITFLEDRNIDYYEMETINKYFNNEFEDRLLSIVVEDIIE